MMEELLEWLKTQLPIGRVEHAQLEPPDAAWFMRVYLHGPCIVEIYLAEQMVDERIFWPDVLKMIKEEIAYSQSDE